MPRFFTALLGLCLGLALQAETYELRNGDLIELGAVKIQFWIAKAEQIRLRWREWLTWLALILLTAAQVAANSAPWALAGSLAATRRGLRHHARAAAVPRGDRRP